MIRKKIFHITLFLLCFNFKTHAKETKHAFYASKATQKTLVIKGNTYTVLNNLVALDLGHHLVSKIKENRNNLSTTKENTDLFMDTKGPFFIYEGNKNLDADFFSASDFRNQTKKSKRYKVLYDFKNKKTIIPREIAVRIENKKEINALEKKYYIKAKTVFSGLKTVIFSLEDPLEIIKKFEELKKESSYKDSYLIVYDYSYKKR